MYKWNYIQTKTELEFIFNILKEQIKGLKVKRIFSFENAVPKKVGEKIIFNTLEEPLYILFDNDYCLKIIFIFYSNIFIEYRKITDEELKNSLNFNQKEIDYLNNHHEIYTHDYNENNKIIKRNLQIIIDISSKYSDILDFKVNGFNHEYEKWINKGSTLTTITIPAGGDYFNAIKLILNNGIEINMCPLDAFDDGYYDLIIEDKNNIIKYTEKKL